MERRWRKMAKRRYCNKCILAKLIVGDVILSSGWKCFKNPFKPEIKPLDGYCEKG
jgi:hypothetical protein